jgi:hypothetical protein
VELGHVAILRRSEKIAPTSAKFSNERKNVSERDLKRIFARRGRALVLVLAIGIGGVAWSGCGDDGDDTSSQIEQNINEGVEEAQDAVEEGVTEAQESLDDTNGETKKELEEARDDVEEGFEEGGDKAQKGIEEGKDKAEEGIEEGKKEAEEGIEEAQK